MKSILIAWKDFMIRVRDRRGFIMMLVMPLVLTAILGSALSGTMGSGSLPEIVVAYYQEDDDAMANTFRAEVLEGEELQDLFEVQEAASREEAEQLVGDERADVAIIMPAKWSEGLMNGELKETTLLTDPAKPVSTSIMESVLLSFSNQIKTISLSTNVVMENVAQSVPAATGTINMNAVANEISSELQQTARNQQDRVKEEVTGSKEVSSMQYYAAGMGVMFLLFNATVGAKMIVNERATETLARLLSTPTSASSVLFGKFFGTLLFAFIQFLVFLTATHYGFGVDWGSDTGQLLAVGMAYSICVSGLSMVIAATIRDEKSADVIGGIGIQLLALLGGSMLPIYQFPDSLRMIANIAPNKWALMSFLDIMGGTSWASLVPATLVLAAVGIVSVTIGTWRLQVR